MASLGLTAVTIVLVLFALRSTGVGAKLLVASFWVAYAFTDLLALGVI